MSKSTDTRPAELAAAPGSALIEVSRTDLDIISRAILENWSMTTNTGPWQSEEDRCRFCYQLAKTTSVKDHALDCPVLVAVSVAPNDQGEAQRPRAPPRLE